MRNLVSFALSHWLQILFRAPHPRRLRGLLAATLAGFAIVSVLQLSAQVVGGTIAGTVTDPTGAVVPNAAVVVHNEDTGLTRTLHTANDGRFAAPSVPAGTYDITVTSQGFAEYHRTGIGLTVGSTAQVPIALRVTGSQVVTVTSKLPPVNVTTEQTDGLVDARQVKQLPLNGRSYDQLMTLDAGVVNYTNQRSGSVGTSNSSVGNMFAVDGRRPQDNLFLLNGIEYTGASLINVTPGGTSGQLLGVEAVREFNVESGTYSAAYGERDGAQISIVTASGTNHINGEVYEFLRNSFFDARNYFDGPRIPEFQRNDFGAALGGPLRKNKLFLFGNYEGYRQNLGLSIVTLVPDNEARQGLVPNATTGVYAPTAFSPISRQLLNLWPVANGPEVLQDNAAGTPIPTGIAKYTGTAPQHIREDFGTTRLDDNLSANDLLFGVYTVDDSTANTPSSDPDSLVNEGLREQVVSVEEQHGFSANLLNTARFGFSRANFLFLSSLPSAVQAVTPTFVTGDPTGAVVISGSTASNGASSITTAGVNTGANNAMTRNLFTVDDHIFWNVHHQQIEAGVWLQRLQSNDNLAQDQYGQASFSSLTTFLNGAIKTFTYAPLATELGWRSVFVNGYLEDTFHLGPRVEVRAGIRTESTTGFSETRGRAGVYSFVNGVIQTNPSVQSNAIDDNRALFLPEPRLGISWDVFGNGRTAVHAGVGLHHSLLDALDYRLDQAAPYNTVYSYSSSTVADPTGVKPQISPSTVATGIATPSLVAYTFKVDQQIGPSTVLSVGYVGSESKHQILSGDLNEPAFTYVNGRVFYPASGTATAPAAPVKANSALANTTSWWSGGSGNYNAMVVELRHDLAQGLELRANYTWSKNLDDGSAWNTSVSSNTPAYVEVPALPHLDYGPAATDIRNIAAISATYDLPFGKGKPRLSDLGPAGERVVSGWSLASIVNAQSGFPFSPQLGYNPTGSGDSRNPVRPNLNPSFSGPLYPGGNTAARVAEYFNPAAFSAPAAGYIGAARRDSLFGPHYAEWDFSLLKTTPLTGTTRLEFRAEFFNLLNHTNLQLPNEVVYSSGPTQGTLANQSTAPALGSPGVIAATAGTSRQIQLGLKLLF